MIACLNPCDANTEENLSTINYAAKASHISNKPIKNDDPKNRQIEELKRQVKLPTEELAKANETIDFLSSVTGKNPALIKQNLDDDGIPFPEGSRRTPPRGERNGERMQRQDSAETQKNRRDGSELRGAHSAADLNEEGG